MKKLSVVDKNIAIQKITYYWIKLNQEKFKNKMDFPVFKLTTSKKILGSYRAFFNSKGHIVTSEIRIHEQIALFAPDRIFETVLLHEMCHQFVSEVFGAVHEGHGELWRYVCEHSDLDPDVRISFNKHGFHVGSKICEQCDSD